MSGVVDAADLWPRVAEAVTALPEPERDALVLHVWEGLSYGESPSRSACPSAPCARD